MSYLLKHWRTYLVPAPSTFYWLTGAAGVSILGALFAIFYSQSGPAEVLVDRVENFSFVLGILVSPVVIILCIMAALSEPAGLAKALIWLFTALLTLLGGGLSAIGLALNTGFVPAFGGWVMVCAPSALVLLMPALYEARHAWPKLRAAIALDQEARTIQMIEARGEVALNELAQTLALSPEACAALIERLLHTERVFGFYDVPRGRLYSAAILRERQHTLQAVVMARGQIPLADLAQELRAPRDLVRDWIYQLVKRGEFTGYINWEDGVLYSAEAEKLAKAGNCPQCGGLLTLVGQGVIQCEHCQSEIFLSPSAPTQPKPMDESSPRKTPGGGLQL